LSGFSGNGKSIGHAGELLQGVVWHDAGPEPFLVTLPAPPFTSRATIHISDEADDQVQPAWKTKALRAARIAWTRLGADGPIRLTSDSRTPVGRGCGSSTCDCVAAIRAVADLLNRPISANEVAQWATEAETAADATMFDLEPLAFRPRRGQVLRPLGLAYPPMRVIAADLGGPEVDTLTRSVPAYSGAEIVAFEDLLAVLEKSIQRNDALGVARVATESAAIQQRYYPHLRWTNFVMVARRVGALGVACAHSGTVAVALLGPQQAAAEEQLAGDLDGLNLPVLARYELAPALKGEAIACLSF
jgi:uncharacterized protein involved in propanediol utilization